jgi:hypothetical protein
MKTFDEMEYHPTTEKLVSILQEKTQNPNPLFFRVQAGYYFALIASMMRTEITTMERGNIPVNLYALNLGTSGSGKGYSTNILENQVIQKFRHKFLEETYPTLAENNLPLLANKRAVRKGTDPEDELIKVQKEFDELGSLVFSFDSGTSPAVKQLRHKLLMGNSGSMNLQIDEIGSNLLANQEVLNTFLELFDVGDVKVKLIKNTADSKRNEEIKGRTPTNMLLFGTPAKLLDGAKVEEELYSMLETGFARRCFFGYSRVSNQDVEQTPEQVLDQLTNRDSNEFLEQLAYTLEQLADISHFNKKLMMTRQTTLTLIEYKMNCEKIARSLPEHEAIKAAEISHRYFKALKLAGAYAFVDDSPEVTEDHVYNAIKLAEESGEAFNKLLTRDRAWVKLAKYLASVKRDVTQADLTEDLPFYKGSASQKSDMLNLAMAWGYKNNIIIKKAFSDGIEFLRGESLDVTDTNRMIVSYSNDLAEGYNNEYAPWDKLHKLTQINGMNWVNHHLVNGHRAEEDAIQGFNLLTIDVDGTVPISTAKMLLEGYKYLIYTTKRHTEEENRFRIILPMNYTLKLDAKDYKEFMKNVFEWLPFEVDEQTHQRARKWMSWDMHFEYGEGELLDVLPFIPKTSKNEERKRVLQDQQSMDNLERWAIKSIGDGNRNNMLLRYAMIFVDAGFDIEQVRQRLFALNDKLPDKLDEAELYSTIMKTVTGAIAKRP